MTDRNLTQRGKEAKVQSCVWSKALFHLLLLCLHSLWSLCLCGEVLLCIAMRRCCELR